ncbi:MAG: hypothetical protein IJY90_03425 [Clostridia bacterium]|nr:hypothetical protein [Clostridia bacterium]
MKNIIKAFLAGSVLVASLAAPTLLSGCGTEQAPTDIAYIKVNDDEMIDAMGTKRLYFDTLPAAVDAIYEYVKETNSKEPITIYLDKNASGDGVRVEADQNIIFDFQGHTYTIHGELAGSAGHKDDGFQLIKRSNVTFKNGKIKQGKQGAVTLVSNYANLTLDNFTLDGTNKDARIECERVLALHFGSSVVTGNSHIFAEDDGKAIYMKYGNLHGTYDEGVFLTFDENFSGSVNGDVVYLKDDTRLDIIDNSWTDYAQLTIKNGDFNVEFEDLPGVDENIQISGGDFDFNVDNYCAHFYDCIETDDGFEIKKTGGFYVEKDGIVTDYSSIGDAVAAIGANEKVTLGIGQDVEAAGLTFENNAKVEIDLYGNTYTITEGSFKAESGASVLIKNGTITSSSIAVANRFGQGVQLANVKVANVTADETIAVDKCKIGYESVNEDGKILVQAVPNTNYVCVVNSEGERNYSADKPDKVIADAETDSTIYFLKDYKETTSILPNKSGVTNKNIIVDLNGFSYKSNAIYVPSGINLTVRNGDMTPYKYTNSVLFVVYSDATLMLEDVTLNGLRRCYIVDKVTNEAEYTDVRCKALITAHQDAIVKVSGGVELIQPALTTWEIEGGVEEPVELNMSDGSMLEICGGSYQLDKFKDFTVVVSGGNHKITDLDSIQNLTIFGGTFDKDVSKYCAEFYECVRNDTSLIYEVSKVDATTKPICVEVEGIKRYYTTIETALASIQSGQDVVVVLSADVSSGAYEIGTGKNVIFNLNKHTWTIKNQGNDSINCLSVSAGSNVTFKDGTITSDGTVKTLLTAEGAVTLDAVILNGNNATDAVAKVAGVTLLGEGKIIAASTNKVALSITGSVVIDENFTGDVYGKFELGSDAALEISSGDYTDDIAKYVKYTFVAEEYVDGNDGLTKYTVVSDGAVPSTAVVAVRDTNNVWTYYDQIRDAIGACQSGATIYLIKSCANKGFSVEKNITIDLQGFTLRIMTSSITIKSGGVLEFKDGLVGTHVYTGDLIVVQDGGTLILNDTEILGQNIRSGQLYTASVLLNIAANGRVDFVGNVAITTKPEDDTVENIGISAAEGSTLDYSQVTKYTLDGEDKTDEVKPKV